MKLLRNSNSTLLTVWFQLSSNQSFTNESRIEAAVIIISRFITGITIMKTKI